jgi:hypothetical protein
LSVDAKCDASRFSLEELSKKLGATVFNPGASLSEKLNLPSSIQKSKNENSINLKIKSDFDLENKEFVRFLKEAYKYFLE